jgi:hypothetical protein
MNIQFVDTCNCGLLTTKLMKIHFVLVIKHGETDGHTPYAVALCIMSIHTKQLLHRSVLIEIFFRGVYA